MHSFILDPVLARDSEQIANLGLCQLRLLNDDRWPWLILVPQRGSMEETFDLTPLDQTMLTLETNLAARALKQATSATKINVGAIGNIVRQLHIHVIARFEGDPNWPGTVWGFGDRQPWQEPRKSAIIKTILDAL